MATYHAIAATGEAILGTLKAARPRPDFDNAEFKLYQSADFQGSPLTEGLSLYLYQVTINTTRRNLPRRVEADGQRFRPSLPLDLHFLLIPWAQNAVKQQWLLGWAMRTLEDTPILPAEILNHYGTGGTIFHPYEAIEIICEPLALQEIVNIWDAFKPNLQLSVAYVARMVCIDSQIALTEAPLSQTRAFERGEER